MISSKETSYAHELFATVVNIWQLGGIYPEECVCPFFMIARHNHTMEVKLCLGPSAIYIHLQ